MPPDAQHLREDFAHYDQRVDVVSSIEVWFTRTAVARTVRHFERYPVFTHPDGNPVTPDFTVVFDDGTGYVGELADIALPEESVDSLCRQIVRYDQLTELPVGRTAGGQVEVGAVSALDHLLFVRHALAGPAQMRVLGRLDDHDHFFALEHPLCFFAWSADAADYTFRREPGPRNPRPRGHGRQPSLESWMAEPKTSDTLTGKPQHYLRVKTDRRLMNDDPKPIYTATLLWSTLLNELSAGRGDVVVRPADLAQTMRERWGKGSADDVRAALYLLVAAKLAVDQRDGSFIVAHRELVARVSVQEQLIDRMQRRPSGPVTLAAQEQAREVRRERDANRAAQTALDLSE